MKKEVLTTGDVAKLCHVTIRTVIKWFEKGHLKGYKIPGSRDRRFARTDVLKFGKAHGIPLSDWGGHAATKKRILIVDDEPPVVAVLEGYLAQLGLFDWQTAKNGYEAGLKTQSFRPHLLLTDYHLGDIDGVQVAESVRAIPELAGMCIVVVSGVLDASKVPGLRNHGIDAFIRKPFTFAEIRDTIFRLLEVS